MNLPFEQLDCERVLSSFRATGCCVPLRLEVVAEIDSTNRHLLEQLQRDGDTGRACLAELQTAGRGRRGKRWMSPPGNIYLSVLWRFDRRREPLGGLSLAAGVAVAELAAHYGASAVALKWPNDVLCDGAKLCGILVETSRTPAGGWAAVIGVGLNFHMIRPDAESIDQPWTDLITASGRPLSRNEVAGRLIASIFDSVSRFEADGMTDVLPRWQRFDMMRGRRVAVSSDETVTYGIARGIDETGALLLEVGGAEHRILSGDVSLRPVC